MAAISRDKIKANWIVRAKFSRKYALIPLLLLFALAMLPPITSAQLVIQGTDCQGNQICRTTTTINPNDPTHPTVDYTCSACPSAQTQCPPSNVVTVVNKVCSKPDPIADAVCVVPNNACTTGTSTDTSVVTLQFNVFSSKSLLITFDQAQKTVLAGTKVTFIGTVKNPNPIDLKVYLVAGQIAGWNITLDKNVIPVAASTQETFTLTVVSPADTQTGSYPITVTTGELQTQLGVFGSATATYRVDYRGAPTIEITPSTQTGLPGQFLLYNVNVTSGDPPGFDASRIVFNEIKPAGWDAHVSKPYIDIMPGESVMLNISVKPPVNATAGDYNFSVNASASMTLSYLGSAIYKVTLCGNGVCDLTENANSCPVDCGPEPLFKCQDIAGTNVVAGRCEQTVDDGIVFNDGNRLATTNFAACKRGASIANCVSDAGSGKTGLSSNALCSNALDSTCKLKCVDSTGAYYLYARGVGLDNRSVYNYSFSCAQVNLQEIKNLRADFANASLLYSQAQSLKAESLRLASNDSMKAQYQLCYDALTSIVADVTNHVKYLDQVIASPAISNTTEARARSEALRADIQNRYNQFCTQDKTGFLRFDKVVPPGLTEIGTKATATATVTNIGNTLYYSYVSCDFTLGTIKSTANTSCRALEPGQSYTANLATDVNSTGNWSLLCRSFGDLNASCVQASVHDAEAGNFDVYTKDIIVSSVSGVCNATAITCTVDASGKQGCASCTAGEQQCIRTGQNGTKSYFSCPKVNGQSNVTGSVFASSMCNPQEPASKSASVTCPYCGDGIVQAPEQCELPGTANNKYVPQMPGPTCETGTTRSTVVKSSFGFCSNTCQAVPDSKTFTCNKGACNATCGDGEVQIINVTLDDGRSCMSLQQCGSGCNFNEATCDSVDQVSQNAPNCATRITSKTCTYNDRMNRYYVNISAYWFGPAGSHDHLEVERDQWKQFNATGAVARLAEMAGPGLKTIKSIVHNTNSSATLCYSQATVLCGLDSSSAGNLTIVRNAPSTAKLVPTPISIQLSSDEGAVVVLTEYVPTGLDIENVTSYPYTAFSNLGSVQRDGQSYDAYAWTVNMTLGRVFTVNYNANFVRDGDYTFIAEAGSGAQLTTETQIIYATSCGSTTAVFAKNAKGECRQFRNACTMDTGFTIVDRCGTVVVEPPPVEPGGIDLIILIPVIAAAVLILLAFVFRHRIGEFFDKENKIMKKLRETAGD